MLQSRTEVSVFNHGFNNDLSDFLNLQDGKLIIACQSVEHPSCPEVKGIQRAKVSLLFSL